MNLLIRRAQLVSPATRPLRFRTVGAEISALHFDGFDHFSLLAQDVWVFGYVWRIDVTIDVPGVRLPAIIHPGSDRSPLRSCLAPPDDQSSWKGKYSATQGSAA